MFDAKKLLDALGTPSGTAPATPAAPAAPPAPPAEAAAPKPAAAANPLGAGTLLSELIGLANQPSPPPPPPPAEAREGEQPPPPPKPKPAPAQPADLTDLLLGKAQEYLRTPQGNAAMNAVVLGLTKAMVNSEVGRKFTETAKTKSIGLFNRFMNKGAGGAQAIEGNAIESRAVPSAPASPAVALAPPAESSSGETALLVMRAMIAAAAADGRIDEGERERILGTLKKAGIDNDGVHIIEAELARPASAAELAAAVKSPEMAIQVYTAARRIITPNTVEERVFLAHLSAALGLDPRVVAQIDALASGAIPG